MPAAQVYRAFTNRIAWGEWFANGIEIDVREGGRLYLWRNDGYYMSGEYVKLETNKLVKIKWHGKNDPAPTKVKVSLEADGDATLIKLAHGGFGEGDEWAEVIKTAKEDWTYSLDNLASVLEEGDDWRVSRRPLMGIYIDGEISEENAEQYNLPKDAKGVYLAGTIPGLGAEAAGLQQNDVVFRFEGFDIENFFSFAPAIRGKQAGDTVKVEYYRDGEKHSAEFELGFFPLPEVPETADGLAKAIKEAYERVNGELDKIFEGVTDDEAGHCPAEDEWSAKKVLCHLILTQRSSANRVAAWADDRYPYEGGPNTPVRINALLAVYPALEDLRAELRRCDAELVTVLENLPDEFVSRKGAYVYIGHYVLQLVDHAERHYDQIREAIGSSRI